MSTGRSTALDVSDPRAPLLATPPARRLDLLGVGECSLDTWLKIDALPPRGGKAAVSDWCERAGGQVATAVLTAARLGLRAAYAGVVGDDAAAETALAPLRAAGVDLSRVSVVRGARTRAAVIAVESSSGERSVLGHRDPRLSAGSEALRALAPEEARLLLLDASDLDVALALAERARAVGRSVVLDLDTASHAAERLLGLADFPIVSEDFAVRAYGSVTAALARMRQLGAKLPVVTLGERGALAQLGEVALASPAPKVSVADTTGAGDVFHGAFAWGLLQGLGAAQLLRVSNAAAAFSCTGLGAQGAIPDAERLRALLVEQTPGYSSS